MCVYMYVCVCMYVCVFIYVCDSLYIYIYIYIYILDHYLIHQCRFNNIYINNCHRLFISFI